MFLAFIVGLIWYLKTKSPEKMGLLVIEKFKNW